MRFTLALFALLIAFGIYTETRPHPKRERLRILAENIISKRIENPEPIEFKDVTYSEDGEQLCGKFFTRGSFTSGEYHYVYDGSDLIIDEFDDPANSAGFAEKFRPCAGEQLRGEVQVAKRGSPGGERMGNKSKRADTVLADTDER